MASEENTAVLLETNRLQLRKFSLADAPFIYKLMNSEGWLKNIGDRRINNLEDAKAYIEKHYIVSNEDRGYGAYIVIYKKTGLAVGSCGLYKRESLDHPDIGFAFLPEYLRNGFGYESAAALMEFARKNYKISKFHGVTIKENKASIHLLKKLGLFETGTISLTDDTEELLLFSTS
ncbi:GNAT family N-acetyltransferase [Constantimarinum furrinae]|uniref:GCN5 family acetyltransferase n=1 Tax=Constantimarinum furrinae TaxID=2562285 RepID=A0A7G8PXY1_9FLAO|nr:GNAT family N-acetyltransferase [Constantimarinum furrinae]QNJ99197.1 GCN5 family acetyltransferase [Constantimarinum furrinae]